MDSRPRPHILISRVEIEEAVTRLAAAIRRDYPAGDLLLLSILKGSFIFTADLVRHLDLPLEVHFVQLSSYGEKMESSGRVRLVQPLHCPIKGRHVLVVEDIVDTGRTLSYLLERLRGERPASLKLCALTDKPSRRVVPVTIDYLGFTVPDKFIVGYGIDWDEKYRHLPDICALEGEE
ncbi:MAG TPA: hypoxanthine phosphoribosyltransferase [Geobacteraceae bacterium]